jgi:hypothetical protein
MTVFRDITFHAAGPASKRSRSAKEGDGMVSNLIELGVWAVVAVALLWLVPRSASRSWAVGLLVCGMVANLSSLIVTAVAYYSPPSVYLDTEKNQLQFHRGETGEVFGVRVNNPPEECRTTDKNRPWDMAVGNLAIIAVALVFLRRTSGAATHPGFQEKGPSDKP